MPGRTITIGGADNAPDPDFVVLFDQRYRVRLVTRSVQKLLEQADKKITSAMENGDSDKVVAAMAEGMDALLAPEGHEAPAKGAIVDAWKADKLALSDMQRLYDELQEVGAGQRPT